MLSADTACSFVFGCIYNARAVVWPGRCQRCNGCEMADPKLAFNVWFSVTVALMPFQVITTTPLAHTCLLCGLLISPASW
ncbi:hypothetical protein DAEQUDRAFT_235633 [Daedalea quercina L-15889]|uniref:Uncharacterized protein n=1 Tax=Daedalea quercina L-15889 TaxID=1314783 RepID=A0A165QW15_9APHY|nr:hypothetical protein DAEQUDRAFT_235633 [Daedalea quercina L-15889]